MNVDQCECHDGEHCQGNHQQAGHRCRNIEGQMALFSEGVILLFEQRGLMLCEGCLLKPIVEPANLDHSLYNRDRKRLGTQETLFDFR